MLRDSPAVIVSHRSAKIFQEPLLSMPFPRSLHDDPLHGKVQQVQLVVKEGSQLLIPVQMGTPAQTVHMLLDSTSSATRIGKEYDAQASSSSKGEADRQRNLQLVLTSGGTQAPLIPLSPGPVLGGAGTTTTLVSEDEDGASDEKNDSDDDTEVRIKRQRCSCFLLGLLAD